MDELTAREIMIVEEKLTPINEREYFDDFLNNTYPDVNICGYNYCASEAFYLIDRLAYDQECVNVLDSECANQILVEINGKYYSYDDAIDLDLD